jgi:hypothetical protein
LPFKEGRTLIASASVVGFNYNLPPPALREHRHHGLARRLLAVGRRAILMIAIGELPQPRCPHWGRHSLHDAHVGVTTR